MRARRGGFGLRAAGKPRRLYAKLAGPLLLRAAGPVTLLATLIAAVFGAFWLNARGIYIIGDISVFDTIFFAGLFSASMAALVSRERQPLIAAAILIANFVLSRFVWTDSDPILTAAVLDLGTATLFLLMGRERWEFLIGLLYVASVLAAGLTFLNVVPDHLERAPGLIAFSFPDIATVLSLGANVILGAASGDWGKRVRSVASVPLRWRATTAM